MIYIYENQAKKVSGFTSFFISFEFNPDIVNALSNIECKYYHKKDKL